MSDRAFYRGAAWTTLAAVLGALLLCVALAVALPASAQVSTPVKQPDQRANGLVLSSATIGNTVRASVNNAQACLGWSITGLTASNAVLLSQTSDDGGATWTSTSARSETPPYSSSLLITADGQYRVDTGARTDARLFVQTGGIGSISVAFNASSVPCLLSTSAPALPGTWFSDESVAYEGHHQFVIGQGGLANFAVTIGTVSGWLEIFDATSVPPDGVVSSCRAVAPPCLQACYYVKSDGTAGGMTGLWTTGQYLPFKTGSVVVFSINGSGCTAKTESSTAWFRGDVQ